MAEMAAKRERERQRFADLEADVTGRGAQTVGGHGTVSWLAVGGLCSCQARCTAALPMTSQPAAGQLGSVSQFDLLPQWLLRLPNLQVFRDKEGRRVSKEEYLEQQAAAKKKAQVGGRGCWGAWGGRVPG